MNFGAVANATLRYRAIARLGETKFGLFSVCLKTISKSATDKELKESRV